MEIGCLVSEMGLCLWRGDNGDGMRNGWVFPCEEEIWNYFLMGSEVEQGWGCMLLNRNPEDC